MAEFKLGRIRFVWKGDWATSTVYYKDDIVRNGGNTYVCIQGHTSPVLFATGQSTYWNKISDGFEWKGDWTTDSLYKINDVVKYGGYLYICNTSHTSASSTTLGLEDDQASWDLFAEGFDYKADWSTNTRYKINDIVKYNGTIYICTDDHTSASTNADGLEVNSAQWDIFSEGFYWTGVWQTSTRYRKNDIVRYGGQLYVANTGHTSAVSAALGLENDQAKWDYLHKGIEYKGTHASATRYKVNDVVKYGGGLWICTTHHTSTTNLAADEGNWAQFVEGLEFEDSWNASRNYQPGDFVTYGGYSYVAKTNNLASKPSDNPGDWDLFTTGFRFLGDWGDDSSNFEYIEGDVVRLGGYTYLCIDKHTGQRPPNTLYWQRLNSGIFWKDDWTDSTLYDAGDAVSHGVNSYICILAHTSDETVAQNRPDQDVAGTYWNVLSGGAESGNLTTEGDIVYYGGAGPARLPIGQPGQVLQVNSTATAPEWNFLGSINNVYYVEANNGVDAPAPGNGVTLDRPFRTVRYATEQIEKGALRPNAKYLIELNKSFIQDEVVEYINTTYPALVYTEATCRRDIGQIVDALIWDLSHGGNERSRTAAISYFDVDGVTYLADNATETADGISYAATVIDAVLSNLELGVDVGTKYGSLTQYINTDYAEESDAQTNVDTLIGIITEAITSGTTNNVPAEYKPNNTIFVKTGEFSEVLPIIVPENTAVVGDELRSTRIVPAGSLIDATDAQYSLGTIARLEAITADIIQNTPIVKTSGNGETQVTTQPAGSATAGAVAADLWQQIYDYIDFGINGGSGDSTTPLTTGTNTPQTSTDYTYATEVLEANRAFLVAEAIAYIAATYTDTATNTNATGNVITITDTSWLQVDTAIVFSGTTFGGITAGTTYYVESIPSGTTFTVSTTRGGSALTLTTASGSMDVDLAYDSTACARDVNAYIDAIKYDLIYTGNYKSLLAGRYYVNAVNGSLQEDMFYMRNGTGLRNCTVQGLTGTLGSANAYGTKRPSAGAFVSLDPGWGPDDTRAWIINKSPYVQNVTTFGTACVGCKIDGDLHNGGNDSIVANDFTQVISDGIGVWCTNLGRTELVSVFSYYAHIGYLAENGGKIRATNGNSSYGDFGTVAEGVDITEVPITGTVNNRSTEAIVDSVFTDANNILIFEYTNAGVNYTSGGTTFTITGEGFGATVNAPQVYNGAVYQVRLRNIDVDADTVGDFGGAGYISATNVAQTGNTTTITLSNTDSRLSAAYVGMAIYITAGTGAGQYGIINSYNAGTKVANIIKESDGSAGWDHVIGNGIEATLDESTTYSIEPRLTFSNPPSGLYADRAKARAVVEDGQIVKIKIWHPGSGYLSTPTLTITDPNNSVEAPFTVRIGDGVLGQPTWTSRGTGFTTASATVTGDGYADNFQSGQYVYVDNLTDVPQAGSNVQISSLSGAFYKLVSVTNLTGTGPYAAQLQLSPELDIEESPNHSDGVTVRRRFSQVRLTGHDFLDVGTGNFANTNYPGEPLIDADPDDEIIESGGGRVFYTSTDQDGNFRVGRLFNVEQSTGVATLNADAFNISGLQELQLGSLELGGSNAVITEFSTDGTFTANSDNIVPTQKAIKTYIASQIGGGAGELNVNSITAGSIKIQTNEITHTSGGTINILQKVNYTGGISGDPVALNYFLLQ